MDEVAGQSPACEVPDIRARERDPESDQRILQLESAAHQEDSEPIGDEEPVRVKDGSRQDDPPGLPVAHECQHGSAPGRWGPTRTGSRLEDQSTLGIADARMLL